MVMRVERVRAKPEVRRGAGDPGFVRRVARHRRRGQRYLLRNDGFNLVIDFGTGVLANVQRYLPHERIVAIVVSHGHLDHCIDLYPLFVAGLFYGKPLPDLEQVLPPGVLDRIARLEDEDGVARAARELRLTRSRARPHLRDRPVPVPDQAAPHLVPNMGMRITAGAATLGYTGDTGPSEEVEALARGADLLLAEASWVDGQEEGKPPIHLTARQAAEHALRADVPHLVLSHFWPTNDASCPGPRPPRASKTGS